MNKEMAQRIMGMYYSLDSDQDKKQFVQLLKDIVQIIEKMSRDDFEQFVEDIRRHLDELEEIKKSTGITESKRE
jgi:hypothetical protein